MANGHIQGPKIGITVAVMTAALMAVLDISIVNVALNDIRASFGTPLDQIAWVSTGYMMANIVVIPMTGWLQRRFGFRRYYTASLLLFTTASVLCGLAWNLPSLVLFRALQGLGGGAIIPTSQAILFARYPKEEHGMAGALFGIGAVTGPLLGPTLGGYLIELSSWHWIFLINLPFGVMASFLAWSTIDEPGFQPTESPIDRWGIALLAIGMASLQYVLEEGNREGWSDSLTIVVLGSVALVALVTFIVHELEAEHPVVDLRVFAIRTYAAATGLNFLTGTALFSGSFLYSLYCGAVMHYTALDIGLLFLKGSVIQLFLMPIIGRFAGKADPRLLVGFGATMLLASLWTNAHLSTTADEAALIAPIFIRACGLGFIFVPLNVAALSDLPPERRGNAAGLFNLTRELGGSIGTAWMSTGLDRSLRHELTYLGERVSIYSSTALDELAAARAGLAGRVADPAAAALGVVGFRVHTQALVRAFNEGFFQVFWVFAVALLLVPLLRRPPAGAPAAPGAH
jgi:DHA2 family multidrug resistance protein